MTGTSLDGLDCALVAIHGTGLDMTARFVQGHSHSLDSIRGSLKGIPHKDLSTEKLRHFHQQRPLRDLASQVPHTAGAIADVMRQFSLLHATAVRELLRNQPCDLVCIHGQTVFHDPPLSWQLFQPAPFVREIGVPVVFDLRQADLAAGGQGAPITPIADWVLFRGEEPRTIINLGGFCNVTNLPGRSGVIDDISAGDVCACNQLLDFIARTRLGSPFDAGGTAALRGERHPAIFGFLMHALNKQFGSSRSLGTGDEMWSALRHFESNASGDCLSHTACEAIAEVLLRTETVCTGVPVLAGGGVRNEQLLRSLQSRDTRITTTASLGVPIEFREATCFAVLGALCQDRVPITLPQVTRLAPGVKPPVAGVWAYP